MKAASAPIPERKDCCFYCRYFWQGARDRNNPCSRGQCRRNPPSVLRESRRLGHAWSWFPYVNAQWRCGEFARKEVVEI